MTLEDVREEHSIKAMSIKTNISEENIEAIVNEDFSALSKAKGLGFISILEREYGADLDALRKKALVYYEGHKELEESINIALPRIEGKKGRSKFFPLLMLGLLAYATWYFFTQFDKRTLGDMIPFTEETNGTDENVEPLLMGMSRKTDEAKDTSLNIENALKSVQTDATGVETDIVVANIEPNEVPNIVHEIKVMAKSKEKNSVTAELSDTVLELSEKIILMPEKRLWFGLVDMDTGKRDHFSISDKFEIDVKQKSWLVATSSATFSFVNANETQEYNDAKEHYFKVSKEGVEHLSKAQYISQGGYKKW